jgi:hypothetical protein
MSTIYRRHRPVVVTSIALAIGMLAPLTSKLGIACYGRGFDPRGPYAEPPQAPFLLPGNVAAMTFGDAEIERGGLYIATSPTGFNDTVKGPHNTNPAAGPIVTAENTTGIYEVGLGENGKCEQLRLVSGGPSKAGSNSATLARTSTA